MTHPHEGTPQFEQQYGNRQGKPIGRSGNGLGNCGVRPVDEVEPLIDVEATEKPVEALIAERWGITLDQLAEASQRLTARQMFVIRLLYGLDDFGVYPHAEVASYMGITREAVYDHEKRALNTLRKLLTETAEFPVSRRA